MDSLIRKPPDPPRRRRFPSLTWRQREYRLWTFFAPLTLGVLLFVTYQTGLLSQIIEGGVPLHPHVASAEDVDTLLPKESADAALAGPPEAIVHAFETAAAIDSQEAEWLGLSKLNFAIVRHDAGFLPEERQLWGNVFFAIRNMTDTSMSSRSLGVVRFSQLYGQPEAYCGKIVTVQGELKRVEQGKPLIDGSPLTPTFRCWIRPESENNPLALDVLELPPSLRALVGKDQTKTSKFTIQADGVFLKRLAYRSRSGPRVAPLVLCRSLTATPQVSAATQEGELQWVPATIASAAVLAVIAIVWIAWRTPRSRPVRSIVQHLLIFGIFLNAFAPLDRAQETSPVAPSLEGVAAAREHKPTLEEYLQILEFTDEDWDKMLNWDSHLRQPVDDGESPPPKEILHSLRSIADLLDRIPPQDLEGWSRSESANRSASLQGCSIRRSIASRTGIISKIRPHGGSRWGHRGSIVPDPQGGESDTILWECLFNTPTLPESNLTCFVRSVPAIWQTVFSAEQKDAVADASGQQPDFGDWFVLGEPATVQGLLIDSPSDASTEDRENPARTMLIAPRVQWYPQRPNPRMQVAESHCLLASAGFDVASLESVTQRGPLTVDDREPFYQLLASVAKIVPHKLRQARETTVPLSRLLQDNGTFRGKIFSFEGTARRAIEIRVDSPDIQERFDIHRYFEVEVFVEPDVRIQFVHPQTGETKAFSRYPLVFCCRDWPEQAPTGEAIHVPVAITGVYLKQWTYRSKFMDQGWSDGNGRVQWSPLLLAAGATLIPPPTTQADPLGWVTGTIIVASIALVAGSALWMAIPVKRA
jgi:hypothetical protein